MKPFIVPDRKQVTLMPPSIDEWLPENHMARFVVEVCEQLDLSAIESLYGHTGSRAYDPRMMLALLFYGYATGVFSSRKLEVATYDSVAFRFVTGDLHPDHDSIATFRRRFLPYIKGLFVQILLIGKEMGFVKMGNVFIDGTKVKANASKHKAMSYGHMKKLEKQLQEEVNRLMAMAEETDTTEKPEIDIPQEIQRREKRLEKIRAGIRVVEERARQRYEEEKAAHDEKMAIRAKKEKQRGRKFGGKKPAPPEEGPRSKDQYNFTDAESRIMKDKSNFDQCYNAQAAVTEDMVIVGGHANNNPNDNREFLPTIDDIPKEIGETVGAGADAGYYSETNVLGSEARNIDPYIATGRQSHNRALEDRLKMVTAPAEPPLREENDCLRSHMINKLKSQKGQALYRLRKMTVEPVFGIIKEVIGFRRFSLRGMEKIDGEWTMVCASYNLKRFFRMKNA